MKINTIVFFEHDKLLRVGVVTKNITIEEMDHSRVQCEIRLRGPVKVETSSLLLTDLTESIDSPEWRSVPVLATIGMSDDYKDALKYQSEKIRKPSEDPDEIPF